MPFLVDAMLGNVAKKLRLLGFDSEYADIDDVRLVEKARNEGRILISRDRNLAALSAKGGISFICISKEGEAEQLLEIMGAVNLRFGTVSGDTARCAKCNSTTSPVGKSKVQGAVPPGVLEFHDRFWRCDGCGQIYWEGTHIANLKEFARKISR